MRTFSMLAASLFVATLARTACATPPAIVAGPTVTLEGHAFSVEIAATPAEQEHGLMDRTVMPADHGMLFVFPDSQPRTFWMKNTLIPLDMIFIGPDRRIAGVVENAAPETETERMVPARSLYVLEIGGGLSARLGIKRGEPVEFQNVPQP